MLSDLMGHMGIGPMWALLAEAGRGMIPLSNNTFLVNWTIVVFANNYVTHTKAQITNDLTDS